MGRLEEKAYDSSRYPHTRKFLLIVGARFCAVVCNKDNLLVFAMVSLNRTNVKFGSESDLYCAAAPESRLFLRTDALRTIGRLSLYIFSFLVHQRPGLGDHWPCQDIANLSIPTIAVKQEDLKTP